MTDGGMSITHNETARRYEAAVDGARAHLQYDRRGKQIVYLHTEVPGALEGRGIGSALARAALEDARAHRLVVAPMCPFVSAYIRRHPEYLPLVDPAHRARMEQAGGA